MDPDLAAEVRRSEIQEKLIAAGSLDAMVGRASYGELREAIELFRKAHGFDQNGLMKLTPVEKDRLAAIYAEFVELTGLSPLDHFEPDRKDPQIKRKLRLFLPLKLVKNEPEEEGYRGDKWLTYTTGSSPNSPVGIGPVIYPLSLQTPISLFKERILEEAVNFDSLHLTSDEFIGRGTFGQGDGVTSYNLVLSHDTELRGLFMRYSNSPAYDRLPTGFKVPDFLIQMAKAEPVTPETEKSDLTARGWQLLMRGITNLIASEFPFNGNGWEKVSTADCPLKNSAHDDPDKLRILFGTNRTIAGPDRFVGKQGETPVADPDAVFTTEPSGALQIGCAYVSKGVADGLSATDDAKWKELIKDLKLIHASKTKDLGDHLYMTDETGGYRGPKTDSAVTGASGATAGGEASWRRRARSDALLFIHGYNVPIKYALQTAAKVAKDIQYEGRVYVYSWPSAQSQWSYIGDLDRAEQAEPYFQSFMRMLMRDANIREIDILAHSMGSQTLLRSLSALRSIFDTRRGGRLQKDEGEDERDKTWRRQGSIRIGQMIFAAPDVDRSVFDQKIRRIAPYAKRITVYVSSSDFALLASKTLRSGVPRVGQLDDNGKPIRVDLDNVHIIDATWKDAWYSWSGVKRLLSGYGHDYFSQAEPVLNDIKAILKASRDEEVMTPTERAPGVFTLKPYNDGSGKSYWELNWTAASK
jgi:alpha/beta hydrolase family protein DUF900